MKKSLKPSEYKFNYLYPDLMDQIDPEDPLLRLASRFPWSKIEDRFFLLYSPKGRNPKPIRLMTGLILLKQLEDLSDEKVVLEWKRNPYFQAFCGEKEFVKTLPCDPSDLVYFRKRIGKEGLEFIFQLSVEIHGNKALEEEVIVDTTVQEKNITYPTDGKLCIKIINRLWKIGNLLEIKRRRSYAKEVKALRIQLRFFKHPKRFKNAKKGLTRLRTIAKTLLREIESKVSKKKREPFQERLELYTKVLNQKKGDKNKIYSLDEPHVYCISKGKDHRKYEYGTKVSVACTKESQVIVGVINHETNQYDGHTLEEVIEHVEHTRNLSPKEMIVDRGYRGKKQVRGVKISLPGVALKRDSEREKELKRKKFRRRAAIEPLIGHLKSDFRLGSRP